MLPEHDYKVSEPWLGSCWCQVWWQKQREEGWAESHIQRTGWPAWKTSNCHWAHCVTPCNPSLGNPNIKTHLIMPHPLKHSGCVTWPQEPPLQHWAHSAAKRPFLPDSHASQHLDLRKLFWWFQGFLGPATNNVPGLLRVQISFPCFQSTHTMFWVIYLEPNWETLKDFFLLYQELGTQ